MYRLGICSVSFRALSPEEIIIHVKNAGLTCIEWGSDVHCPPEKANEIAALSKQYGIECCSYGTYFRLGVTPVNELERYITAAKALGTDILRVWCGDKNSQDYTEKQKTALFKECKAAAQIAEKNGVILCMECHNGTLTNEKQAAYELMQKVSSDSFRMYWQPNQFKTEAENIEYAKLLCPYTKNVHVFNWKGKQKYPLCEAKGIWTKYLKCFDKNRALLLEFMPDGDPSSLVTEAAALKEITGDL